VEDYFEDPREQIVKGASRMRKVVIDMKEARSRISLKRQTVQSKFIELNQRHGLATTPQEAIDTLQVMEDYAKKYIKTLNNLDSVLDKFLAETETTQEEDTL
jgi:hypothetical protein